MLVVLLPTWTIENLSLAELPYPLFEEVELIIYGNVIVGFKLDVKSQDI